MPEKPPRGYRTNDRGLNHHFVYDFTLDITDETKNSTIATLLRTSDDTVDPSTIEVNDRNANFAEDAGPLICADSIVQKMSCIKVMGLTELAYSTDRLYNVKLMQSQIAGCFPEDWNPLDDRTSLKVEDICEVTYDATKQDVTPKFSGIDLPEGNSGAHPFSDVTDAEVFGDYNLTTSDNNESVAFDLDTYFSARKNYSNKGALKKVMPFIRSHRLNAAKEYGKSFSMTKFIPERCRYGREGLFLGDLIHLPIYTRPEQFTDSFTAPTAGAHVFVKYIVNFTEFNTEFNQKRG